MNISKKKISKLTPKCTDLIMKCFLNGKEIECFGEKAFQEGLTMYGPCCIFNSKDRYNFTYKKNFKLNNLILSNINLNKI